MYLAIQAGASGGGTGGGGIAGVQPPPPSPVAGDWLIAIGDLDGDGIGDVIAGGGGVPPA